MREIVFNMVNPCPNQVQTSIFSTSIVLQCCFHQLHQGDYVIIVITD